MARPRRSATGGKQTSDITVAGPSDTSQRSSRSSRFATLKSRASRTIPSSTDVESSEDEINVSKPTTASRRVVKGIALPQVGAMARSSFIKSEPKGTSSTDSSISSVADTSRDTSVEYETPGTTPATSIKGATMSTAKRKRSTLGQSVYQMGDSEEEDDEEMALRLQEEEYTQTGAATLPAPKRIKTAIADSEDEESELSEPGSVQSLDSMPLARSSRRPVAVKIETAKSSAFKGKSKKLVLSSKKATPPRKASTNARKSLGKKLKIEDSDDQGEELGGSDSEDDFVVQDSESEDVSTGVSDAESDIPLVTAKASAASSSALRGIVRRPARGRASARGRGRRFGNITAQQARQIGADIEETVSLALMSRKERERKKLEKAHPEIKTMWETLEDIEVIKPIPAAQPDSINRKLKPFQLEGLNWMIRQEKSSYEGGLLGDEMGMGKTIQAVSLIMSDHPQKDPTLVVVPPVALMQWSSEITDYTDGKLKVLVYHGQNTKIKKMSVRELKKYDVIMISYNSLESLYRKETKGWSRGEDIIKEDSPIHAIHFHRLILDEAHSIKTRTTGVAKACFALTGTYKWCLSGTPVQNRIGEFFSLLRFLEVRPFADYFCKRCPCSMLHWELDDDHTCKSCKHTGMEHVSVFNQELLNPLTQSEEPGDRTKAMDKLHMITARIMLRRVKRDYVSSMELPPKEVILHQEFFGDVERDFSQSVMSDTTRKFDTYVARGVMLNNYANIFGLIMQMRQVANHPDLLLKRTAEEGQNVLVCNICDEVAEEAIRSQCKHDFCRQCVKSYVQSVEDEGGEADCPRCHIPLAIDFDQAEIEQDEDNVKKSSIINRINMKDWTSSSKIEMLVYDLYKLRSKKQTLKSIVFSQFTSMLQLIEWRLRRAGFNTVMLDGSMTPIQRQRSIEHFMTNPDCEVFLVSLKAGGVALNLTEASRVYIVDPWWNPAAEWQSADRCHRIGQKRPCVITRLCIEDSVESRMVMLQEKKANMINGTINNDKTSMEKLTPEDMQFLFRGT